MLKYLSKFAMDILPSVAATIIGAYIVNHYIVTKPGADPSTAAAVSSADPKAAAKPSETPADLASIPMAGVKAKGISEKGILEKTAAEKPSVVEKSQEKSADAKSADAPAETASIPADPRRHPAPREKAVAKVVAAPVQPAVMPVAVTPNPTPAVEALATPEERRDANDLARAAIDRLRGSGETASRPQEPARPQQDAARIPDAPHVVAGPVIRPLPPPIMVSTPSGEVFDPASSPAKPPYAASARVDDPRRPTPPADIPSSRPPLDLRAEAAEPAREPHTNVAEDVLSAAKSVFHAVLPK